VLLRINANTGHSASTKELSVARYTDEWAFVAEALP
jgi:hypothetical protein